MFCDLHMHSTASDGTDPPGALAALAAAAGLRAIALTDHDTTAGLAACAAGCRQANIEFVPGIEISADPAPVKPPREEAGGGGEVRGTLHILGLFVRSDAPQLAAVSQQMEAARNQRNPAIVARLNELGVRIDYDEVRAVAAAEGATIIGRPHIAQVLLAKGYVKSIQDAFHRYLGSGAPAYVRRDRLHPRAAIDAIHHAGGLAIVAHPVQLKCKDADELAYTIRKLADLGLDGIETRHCDHTATQVSELKELAARLGLLESGGSDYHGSRKSVALGSQQVPYDVYKRLRAAGAPPGKGDAFRTEP